MADDVRIGGRARRLVHQPAFEHHHDAIGELHQLVEVFAQEQHGGPCVSRRHDTPPDLGGGGHVEARARVLGDEHLRRLRQFAGQHGPLHVAARERVQARVRPRRADLEALDQLTALSA